VDQKLDAFDRGQSIGQRPALPVYREPGSERPPTRVWHGIVSTGAANDLDPKLFFDLARYYTRLDSFGERYIRYNDFTEQRVFPLGADQAAIYDESTGRLNPEYAAYVDRLRDLEQLAKELDTLAADLKTRLDAQR
jgi:hypothetical protein